jgi:myo-inositol-1(or 4)-monophosphatase
VNHLIEHSTELTWLLGLGKRWRLRLHELIADCDSLKVIDKGKFGPASNVDLELEKFLIQELEKQYPEDSVLSEEKFFFDQQNIQEFEKSTKRTWVIDPLDGTSNFLKGSDYYCLSIALVSQGEIELGLVLRPSTQEYFYAEKGKGAFHWNEGMNHNPYLIAKKSNTIELNRATIAISPIKSRIKVSDEAIKQQLELIKTVGCYRRFGSAALDIASCVVGRLDGYAESGLSPWDIAAGILLCSEAGVEILELETRGSARVFDSNIVVARSPFMENFKPSF